VNTTPKPNATKKSNGELVGPFDPLAVVVDIVGLTVVDVGVVRGVGVALGNWDELWVSCEWSS
jgi:hypothetical protein